MNQHEGIPDCNYVCLDEIPIFNFLFQGQYGCKWETQRAFESFLGFLFQATWDMLSALSFCDSPLLNYCMLAFPVRTLPESEAIEAWKGCSQLVLVVLNFNHLVSMILIDFQLFNQN